ncbi:unnamed protein product [Boreogadus saida]
MVSSGSSKMLEPSSRVDGCVSEPRSEAAVETDRFGFLLANGSASGSGPPPELVRQREAKWIHIISQWDHALQKKNSKVKEQCLKGIPASLRAKAWPLLCGATQLMKDNTSLYQSLDSRPALQSWVDIIERDLDRQFPFHEMFVSKDGHGQRGMFRVLKAYTQYQPDEGYCQAQGPVAAVLLMNMPAEEAFWCLVQISEQYLPGYYSQLLEGVLFDAAMLSWVLKRACPPAHRHLQRYGVEPLMFATDWLMCLFTRHLPFNTLLRVWDLFFCYGVRVLFQVAVVLVRRVLGRADQRQECSGQMETLERLRGVRESLGLEDDASFMAEVCSVPLSRSDLKRRTEKELETWRKDRPSSTFDPRGRCHGYWASRETLGEERDRRGVNLSAPLVRSASALSLSPSLFRKRWGKRSDAARVERHHSMGVQGVGREGWPNARALRVTRVREEEDGHKAPDNLQSRRDTESTPPTGRRRPPQREEEPGESHDSERNTLKGEPGEQVGIGHRTREEQGEQSPGGSGTVQEVIQHHPDLREGAAGGGATQRSAINLQPRTLKNNNQSQVPVEQDLTDNNQSQVPEEQDLTDNNQSQVPEEQDLTDNNQSQVPEEQDLKDNNQSQVPEEQELRDNNQSQVPEEQELSDNNQSQVPEEQELRDNIQSQVPEEQELRDNNQSQVPEEQELRDNNQSQVPEEQELRDNKSEVQEEQKCNNKPNPKEEVSQKKQRVKTLYEMAEQAALCRNLVAGQEHVTPQDTNTDTESQAAVDNTEQRSEATPGQETVTHTDIGTTEWESVAHKSTIESPSEQGSAVMIQEVKDAAAGQTETEAPTANLSSTQKQTNVGSDNEDVDGGKIVIFKSEALNENTLSFQEVGVLTHKGVPQSGETREGDCTMTAILLETTVVPEASGGTRGTAEASCSERASAQEDALCFGHKLQDKPVLETNAETEEDNDMTTCDQTALLEVQVSPRSPTGDRMCYPPTGAAEPLATEEPAVQVSANDKEPVDSSEVTLTPDPSTQQPSGGSEDRGARQRIQDAPLSMGAGPPVSLCIPVSAPLSSQTPTPSGDFRVRKTSHGSRLARRLSEDIFTALETSRFRPHPDPQKGPPAPSRPGLRSPPPGALSALPPPQGPPGPTGGGTSEEPPRRPGFFSRLRGGRPNHHKDTKAERANTQKIQIPKIFLQDFSSGVGEERPLQEPEEQLSSRGRRRRRRERELKEREEEKERRRVEKELKKEGRKRDRKAEWPRGKKLTATSPGSLSGAQHSCSSAHSDSYF